MNDLADVCFFNNSLMASGLHEILIMPDETTYNYVTRLMLLEPAMDRQRIVEQLFGSRSIRPEKPLHSGFGSFTQHLNNSATGNHDAIREHSMLPFFRPFVDASCYEHACKLANSPSCSGLNMLIGLRGEGVFRAHPAICLECTRKDIQKQHFSYYRRSHQVLAVSHCATHHTPLITRCSACNTPFSHWNTPSLSCHNCGAHLEQQECAPGSLSDLDARIRLSKVVADVFDNKITSVEAGLRLATIHSRVQQVVKNRSGVTGDNLATYLNQMFGREFLATLGLQTDDAPTLGWPALLIHGRILVHDPVANCLLIAALFESTDHYNNAVNAHASLPESTRIKVNILGTPGKISFAILKETLRSSVLKNVMQHRDYNQLKKWVAAYPGLSERRAATIHKNRMKNYKDSILTILQEEPGLTRTQVSKKLNRPVAHIQRHDPQWLDHVLPTKKELYGAVATVASNRLRFNELEDDEQSEILSSTVSKILSSRKRPCRLTYTKVISLSGLAKMPDDMRDKFPKTVALANQLCEDMETFYKRSLRWAASSLKRYYGACNNISELFVHAKISLEYIKPLESYARSLLDEEQATSHDGNTNGISSKSAATAQM